ncbi:heterokaryon incompatibility protein-domain-containing protein [Leptodontidium sp. MPI-SDFR-AT-0119]|nr:heterokaryon incompatibility protein-domain-containing protein [Leptodontidium sp. MPI-SDFR-AT-0119]
MASLVKGLGPEEDRAAHALPDYGQIIRSLLDKGEKLHADVRSQDALQKLPVAVDLEPFCYTALPTPTSIRVLRIEPAAEDSSILELTLHVIDLKDNPSFNALSYVWADHRPQLHQSYNPNRSWRKFQVMCDERGLYVTYNLFRALQQFQRRQGASPMNDIWIDQICINQEDLEERGAQVAIMGDIYRAAEKVLSWLGPEDSYTEEALNFLSKLAAIPEAHYGKIARDITSFILELPSKGWESLSSLLSRPYFNRAWVVQEVVLAKNLTMLCGSKDFHWEDLVRVSRFLQSTKPWALLADHAARFIPVEDRLNSKKDGLPVEFGSQLSSLIEVKKRAMNTSVPWQELLVIGREFGATIPQDKFYAMLGLVNGRLSGKTNVVDIPSVSYSKTTEDVALEFSKLYLKAANNLQILTQIEDAEYRINKGLPSWVPDSETRLLPKSLDYVTHTDTDGTDLPQIASADTTPCFSLDSSGRILHVEGAHLDSIIEVSTSFNEIKDSHNWLSILKLLKTVVVPEQYSASIDEVFICTLLTISPDSNSKNPAPSIPVLEFSDWMINNLALIERGANANYISNNGLGLSELLDNTQQALEDLWKANSSGAFPGPDRVKETLRVLDRFKEGSPERESVQRHVESFEAKLGMRLHSRRMFVTSSGCLGLGPQSLQVGDAVYYLRGANMPLVLRRQGAVTHQVVGHAFVYGLLEERVTRDELEMEEISLI